MITHQIQKYLPPQSNNVIPIRGKYHGIKGTTDHRKWIHSRAYSNCKFIKGESVLYKKQVWAIQEIIAPEDFQYVNWLQFEPCFIELVSEYGEIALAPLGQLKRFS